MNKRIFLILVTTTLNTTIYSQELNNLFSTIYKKNIFNGSVIVSNSEKTIFSDSYGFSNIEKEEKFNDKSQFPIASITKTFTSTAILQLKQKGKLKIEDPVQKYLLDFPYPNITIRQLISNTSGLAQYYNLFDATMKEQPDKTISNQDLIPAFIRFKTPLSFLPGSRWEYNNVNFCLAALIIEKISGISYAEYLQKNIFGPAKMENTFVPNERKIKKPNQVELYSYPNFYSTNLVDTKKLEEPFLIDAKSNFYGNGGIVSTAADLQKYQNALFTNKIIGKKELEEALTETTLNDGKKVTYVLEGKEMSYGLGWAMYTDESNGKIIFHDGSISGLSSILIYNLQKKQSIILLSNTGNCPVLNISDAVFQILDNKPYTVPERNLSRIYGSLLESGNKEKANQLIEEYLKNSSTYEVSERDFNRLGYQFLRSQKSANSLETFHTATLLFPKSANIYDSYGEALLQCGKKDDAIKMYQKSVELDPDSENGKNVLNNLLKK